MDLSIKVCTKQRHRPWLVTLCLGPVPLLCRDFFQHFLLESRIMEWKELGFVGVFSRSSVGGILPLYHSCEYLWTFE
jgi:hypothetical protein